jgi:hypothetical protein
MIQSCSPQYLKALQPFNSRLGFMAGITNGFKIRIIIGTPMSLSLDMVHGLSCFRTTVTQTVLTQVIVTFKNAGSLNITGYHSRAHACSCPADAAASLHYDASRSSLSGRLLCLRIHAYGMLGVSAGMIKSL